MSNAARQASPGEGEAATMTTPTSNAPVSLHDAPSARGPHARAILAAMLTPGSPEAERAGCTCPMMVNIQGRGPTVTHDHRTQYWMRFDCPLHGALACAAAEAQAPHYEEKPQP